MRSIHGSWSFESLWICFSFSTGRMKMRSPEHQRHWLQTEGKFVAHTLNIFEILWILDPARPLQFLAEFSYTNNLRSQLLQPDKGENTSRQMSHVLHVLHMKAGTSRSGWSLYRTNHLRKLPEMLRNLSVKTRKQRRETELQERSRTCHNVSMRIWKQEQCRNSKCKWERGCHLTGSMTMTARLIGQSCHPNENGEFSIIHVRLLTEALRERCPIFAGQGQKDIISNFDLVNQMSGCF